MISEFKLVGLNKGGGTDRALAATGYSATCESAKEAIFWVSIDMPEDRIKALWDYCKGNWADKKIAVIEHGGLYHDGTPISPTLLEIKEAHA